MNQWLGTRNSETCVIESHSNAYSVSSSKFIYLVLPDVGFAEFAYNWRRALRVTLIHVQCDCISSRFAMHSLKTRHSVLCLSVVVLEFDGGFEGRQHLQCLVF